MKTFKISWLSGRIEFLKGNDITTALINARHSKSAIRAIKKYEEVNYSKLEIPVSQLPIVTGQLRRLSIVVPTTVELLRFKPCLSMFRAAL